MSLERFKIAQDAPQTGLEVALQELNAGRKSSHWIWYIFPQLRILGRSSTAQFYGIENAKEACEYLNDPMLAGNLILALEAVLSQLEKEVPLDVLMGGSTDSLKLLSCVTLFKRITENVSPSTGASNTSRVHSLTERILEIAQKHGYSECSFTLGALR